MTLTWCINQPPAAKPGTLTRTWTTVCGSPWVLMVTQATELMSIARKSVVIAATPQAVPNRERKRRTP